ncbi:BspC domain-containing protein, partial [Paraburkholderia sp. BR14261]
RRALSAKIEQPAPANATPTPVASDALSPAPSIDTLVHLRAFAKVRGKYAWVPVKATCGIWHSHVVDVALSPRGTHATSPIH